MQEAVDEIVNLLTEDEYRGKMVVIFAGYAGQMSELLNKVISPGLESIPPRSPPPPLNRGATSTQAQTHHTSHPRCPSSLHAGQPGAQVARL